MFTAYAIIKQLKYAYCLCYCEIALVINNINAIYMLMAYAIYDCCFSKTAIC